MPYLSLEIAQDVAEAIAPYAPEIKAELLQDLAVILYRRNILTLFEARQLTQMTRYDFIELLGQRDVPRHYTEEDLKADIEYGLGKH